MTSKGRTKVSTHVLDLVSGTPASGIAVKVLDARETLVSSAFTNEDGRIELWDGVVDFGPGTYRLIFVVANYRETQGDTEGGIFFPRIEIVFRVDGLRPRLHVPVLLSAYGYTTYRGS